MTDIDNEAVERVARAIVAEINKNDSIDLAWQDGTEEGRNEARGIARAAIAAMPDDPSHAELEDASTACIELAAKHGFATGHGDTVADMIREFSAQIGAVKELSLARQIMLLGQSD